MFKLYIQFYSYDFFRYFVVCHSTAFNGKERKLGRQVRDLVIYISAVIGISSIFYSEHINIFLLCMGKQERFIFDMSSFDKQSLGGPDINLGFVHPFRFTSIVAGYLFIFAVPVFYYKIYTFRKQQEKSVKGISY